MPLGSRTLNIDNRPALTQESLFVPADTLRSASYQGTAPQNQPRDNHLENYGILAKTIYGEAEPTNESVRAVASTLDNRAKNPRIFNKTQAATISDQYKAFNPFSLNSQYSQYDIDNSPAAKNKRALVDKVIEEMKQGTFRSTVGDLNSFNQEPKEGRIKVGKHYFFKDEHLRTR